MASVNDSRSILKMDAPDLNALLGDFLMDIKKLNGDDYEPDCTPTIWRGIHRYLENNKYPFSIIEHAAFLQSRKMLGSKRKQLTAKGLGGKPNATRELSVEEVDLLFREGYFGLSSGQSVQRTVWWFVSIHFGFRGKDEARKLCWGDITLEYNKVRFSNTTLQIF